MEFGDPASEMGSIDLDSLDQTFASSPLGQTLGNDFDIEAVYNKLMESFSENAIASKTKDSSFIPPPETPKLSMAGVQIPGIIVPNEQSQATKDQQSAEELKTKSPIKGPTGDLAEGKIPEKPKSKGRKLLDTSEEVITFVGKLLQSLTKEKQGSM